MARFILIAALAGAMFAVLPAYAQDVELDGAPPPLQIPKPTPPAPKPAKPTPTKPAPAKPAPADTPSKAEQALKTEQARLAQQAQAQTAESARLARLSADLQAQKARLDARAVELADQEKRLAREREDQDADYARKLAELDRPRVTPPATTPLPPAPARVRVSYEDARTACARAGMDEATDNDFYSARYESAPRYYASQREVRGRMRMDDRRGYLTVDTICQLDANGAVLRFEVVP